MSDDGLFDPNLETNAQQYNNRRRLKAINDLRERVDETVWRAEEGMMEGTVSRDEANSAVKRVVSLLIRNSHHLLKQHPQSDEWLWNKEIGSFQVKGNFTAADFEPESAEINAPPAVETDGRQVTIYGLRGFVQTDPKLTIELKGWDSHVVRGKEDISATTYTTIPIEVSLDARDTLTEFFSDVGLNINFEEGRSGGSIPSTTPDIPSGETPPPPQ